MIIESVDLSALSSWRIGGTARIFEPESESDLVDFLAYLRAQNIPWIVIGETTNLLFDSKGFKGILIKIGSNFSTIKYIDNRVIAGAGILVDTLVQDVATKGLAGIEHAAGIPGTLGGLVVMNGGTRRQGIGQSISKVHAVDANGHRLQFTKSDMDLGYRRTIFQKIKCVLTDIELELSSSDSSMLLEFIQNSISERTSKFPLDTPNCGSTFLSDPKFYKEFGSPGAMIEKASLKGLSRGSAEVSTQHANFILNHGTSTDSDVLWLIATIRKKVFEQTGHLLKCEVRHVNYNGVMRPAHIAAGRRWPEIDPEGMKTS